MMAVLAVLGLAGAVIPLTTTDVAVAANHRQAAQLVYSAEAALEAAISDLGTLPAWDDVFRSGSVARRWSRASQVRLVDGQLFDLADVTRDLRRTRGVGGVLAWRFLGSLSLDRLISFDASPGPVVAAVWLAAYPRDAAGASPSNANDALALYASAFGRGGARRSIRAVIRRHERAGIEVSSWRLVR